MKKLMIAAAAVAMVGAASAVQVADYRSTVKFVNMKQWSTSIDGIKPLVKYVDITTLRGYVVYNDCACNEGLFGENTINPAFLVVKSFAQPATDNLPKILPADLLVKFIDNSCGLRKAEDEIGAEGYLFAGAGKGSHEYFGDDGFKEGVAPWMLDLGYQFGSATTATRYLFGKYNDVKVGETFYDAWLDHAGFGSAWYNAEESGCAEGAKGNCLKKLMGYVIGGSYICHPNGYSLPGNAIGQYEWFPCHAWLGTTDVVAGYWGMKKVIAEGDQLAPEDDKIFLAFETSEGDEDPNADLIKATLGQVKACVNHMTNGGQKNLSFIQDDNTVSVLTKGFEYETEE